MRVCRGQTSTFDVPQELPILFLETGSLPDYTLGWAAWPGALGSLVSAFLVLNYIQLLPWVLGIALRFSRFCNKHLTNGAIPLDSVSS